MGPTTTAQEGCVSQEGMGGEEGERELAVFREQSFLDEFTVLNRSFLFRFFDLL